MRATLMTSFGRPEYDDSDLSPMSSESSQSQSSRKLETNWQKGFTGAQQVQQRHTKIRVSWCIWNDNARHRRVLRTSCQGTAPTTSRLPAVLRSCRGYLESTGNTFADPTATCVAVRARVSSGHRVDAVRCIHVWWPIHLGGRISLRLVCDPKCAPNLNKFYTHTKYMVTKFALVKHHLERSHCI